MIDDHAPILVGAGQLTQRDVEPAEALEPLAMMDAVARRAADDAGAGPRLLAAIDRLAVVNFFSWEYGNAPAALAERLGAHPREALYTTVGGNTPQWLVEDTAAAIAAGRVRVALLAGAETVRTVMRARKTRTRLAWSSGGEGTPTIVGDPRDGTSALEVHNGLQLPTQIYPLFENAFRARRGLSLAAHRERLGNLCARLSAVAAEHPYAWFPTARTAAEITTVSAANRMIGFPYPKLMNAIIEVDQAAAVLMTSAGTARALGIPAERWVYLWSTGAAHDRWFVTERPDLSISPAIREAGRQALEGAGIGIERVDLFDLYSCFPCAVELGREALGIPEDDPRPLTVTGGLPYFGGPGNNYSMHAIASMMDRLRARPEAVGLVSALGWFITKHAIGIYSAAAPARPYARPEQASRQRALDAVPPVSPVPVAQGAASIETYTVLYDRDGAPMRGLVIGRLDDGRRFLADTPDDRALLEDLVAHEGVGRRGRATHADGTNRFTPS